MAATGHADDCAACAGDGAGHTRQAPPTEPVCAVPVGVRVGAGVTLVAFAWAVVSEASAALLVVGAAVAVTMWLANRARLDRETAWAAWGAQVEVWKVGQTEAWLTARRAGKTWPCPTCSSRTCGGQHTVTSTRGVRIGSLYSGSSRTDSV